MYVDKLSKKIDLLLGNDFDHKLFGFNRPLQAQRWLNRVQRTFLDARRPRGQIFRHTAKVASEQEEIHLTTNLVLYK